MINRGKLSLRKRLLAGALALSMAFGMAGCGKKEGGNSESGNGGSGNGSTMETKVDVKNCTFEEDSDFSFEIPTENVNQAAKVGDYLVVLGYEEGAPADAAKATASDSATGGDADGEMMSEYYPVVYTMPAAGGEAKKVFKLEKGYVNSITAAGDNIAMLIGDVNDKYSLKVIDKDGKEVSTVSLDDVQKHGSYISSVKYLDNGDIAASTDKDLVIIGADGKEKKSITFEDYLMGCAVSKDGKVFALTYGMTAGKSEAVEINIETGEQGEHYPLSAQYFASAEAVQKGIGDYDFIYASDDALFGYKLATKEDVRICDFNASLIDGSYITSVIVSDLDHFITCGTNYTTGDSFIDAYKKVDPANVKDKKVLTLACLYQSNELRQNVIDFNKTHTDVRIDIIDYNNEEDSMTKFSTDIAAGNIPDLYDVSQGFGNMSLTQAANKGMFVDLTSYLQNDPDLSEDDIIDSVLNSTKINDKIYYLGSSFALTTLIGNKDDLGKMDGWTFDEMKQYIESKPEGSRLFETNNKTYILDYFLYTCLEEFVDYNKGECYFDQQSFKNVLELANKGDNEEEDFSYEDSMSFVDDIRSGKQLFEISQITPDYWPLYNSLFNDKGYCIGFPNKDRQGTYVMVESAIAMSAGCSDKDTAWEFIKFTMSKEQQGKTYYGSYSGMPTRKDVFEMYLEAKGATKEYTDEFGNDITPLDGAIGMGDVMVEIKPITEEEKQQYRDLVAKAHNVWEYDQSLMDIVEEESKEYFNGEKSLDEVCTTIQNRASTYIQENQ